MADVHAEAHPKWWHVSLTVMEDGLISKEMASPNSEKIHLMINLKIHAVELYQDGQVVKSFNMTEGLTGTQMGDALIEAVASLGLESDEYVREKFENDDPREYDLVII